MMIFKRPIKQRKTNGSKSVKGKSALKTWEIPDERKIYEFGVQEGWQWYNEHQKIAPASKRISKILGLKKNSRVLFISGCYGDWTKALSQNGLRVTYSDVSKSMADGVKRLKGKIEKYRVFEGSQWPRKPGKYDWSVSFEPVALEGVSLQLTMMRSLLNTMGAKLIYSTGVPERAEVSRSVGKKIANLYSASCKMKKKHVFDSVRRRRRAIYVITLRTNEEARRKAWIDLQVLKTVRSKRKPKKRKEFTVRELLSTERIKRLGISKEELMESLDRLAALADLSRFVVPSGKKQVKEN